MSLPPAICIMGPTASGKTGLAVDLVQHYPCDIISVDFGTLYKGYYGDSAVTIPVGTIDNVKNKLLEVTDESLHKAIEQVEGAVICPMDIF